MDGKQKTYERMREWIAKLIQCDAAELPAWEKIRHRIQSTRFQAYPFAMMTPEVVLELVKINCREPVFAEFGTAEQIESLLLFLADPAHGLERVFFHQFLVDLAKN